MKHLFRFIFLAAMLSSLSAWAVPVANIVGPTSGSVNTSYTFSSTGSTFDGSFNRQYYWYYLGQYYYTSSISLRFPTEGSHTIWLLVSNGVSNSQWRQHTINITNTVTINLGGGFTLPPSVTISGPTSANLGETVSFTAQARNFKSSRLTYNWSADGTRYSGSSIQHTFRNLGTRYVTLIVTSDQGEASNYLFKTIDVTQAIQPTANFTFSPASPCAGTLINFRASSQNFSTTALTYTWTVGGQLPQTEYDTQFFRLIPFGGNYSVKLVISGGGQRAEVIKNVKVLSRGDAACSTQPTADLSLSQGSCAPGQIRLVASTRNFTDSPLYYYWTVGGQAEQWSGTNAFLNRYMPFSGTFGFKLRVVGARQNAEKIKSINVPSCN